MTPAEDEDEVRIRTQTLEENLLTVSKAILGDRFDVVMEQGIVTAAPFVVVAIMAHSEVEAVMLAQELKDELANHWLAFRGWGITYLEKGGAGL